MRLRRIAVVMATTLLTAAACGRAGTENQELLSPTPSPSVDCAPESIPEVLPPASAIVDSARLVELVSEYARSDSTVFGSVLLTMAFDTAGENTRREVVEHSTTPIVADSVQRLVFASLRPVDSSEREWGVRLRVDVDYGVQLLVGRREFCPAVPLDYSLEEAMAGFNPAGIRYRRGRRERVLEMRAVVNEGGFITTAQVERGGLGGSSLERDLVQYLRQFRFRPATIDGFPVRSTVSIPMTIRE